MFEKQQGRVQDSQDCIHHLFERQAARTPRACAVTMGKSSITYAELDRRANLVATHLVNAGVGVETVVAVYMERSIDLVVSILGALKAGGAYLPLDPLYPPERIAFILNDAKARIMITQEQLARHLPSVPVTMIRYESTQVSTGDIPVGLAPTPTGTNLAYVIFTSGSTGMPKGVEITHSNVVQLFKSVGLRFKFSSSDVWTMFHSCAFDFSVWEMWGALLHGGRLVIVPRSVTRSPQDFLNLLIDQQVTVLSQTPSAFNELIMMRWPVGLDHRPPLRLVILGGEALDIRRLEPWFRQHGDSLPRVINMYGITETTVHVTYRRLRMRDTRQPVRSPIGRPLPGRAVMLLDEERRPVEDGTVGEMFVSGSGVARGYRFRPDLNTEKFVCLSIDGGNSKRYYRSGDLARRLPNGELDYIGRVDHQVKIWGFRIELGEIESVLSRHPDVAQCVVLAEESQTRAKRLVAYVVLHIGRQIERQSLQVHVRSLLPNYMVPAQYVPLERLPLTPNGKVDQEALRNIGRMTTPVDTQFNPSSCRMESRIARLWGSALGIDPVSISVNESFFDLGGDSVLAAQMVLAIRDEFQVDLPLSVLFTNAFTIAEMATVVGQLRASTSVRESGLT